MWKNNTISAYIMPLTQFGTMGKVHSVFEHSFNIQVGKQLINIGSYARYLSSFGLYIDQEHFEKILPYIQKGNIVRLRGNKLMLYSHEGIGEIHTDQLSVLSFKIQPIKKNNTTLTYLYDILQKSTRLNDIGFIKDPTFFQLLAKLESAKQITWDETVTYLIGRGKGLTPSGDDFLVAYLFIMHLFSEKTATQINQAIKRTDRQTTDVSQAYIDACMRGHVSSPIYELFVALKDRQGQDSLAACINQIYSIGHTSGKDMCLGILTGIKAIMNIEKGE